MIMPKSSHFELLPSSFTKSLAMIDPSKCSRTIGSEGARSRVPAKFKCGRTSTPANFQSPASMVGIHMVVDWITGYIKRPRSALHIISLALVDPKPTKSTQEWRSRWVEDCKRKESTESVRLCLKSIGFDCTLECFRERGLPPGIHSRIVKFASEHQSELVLTQILSEY